MAEFRRLRSTAVALLRDDIDTDQIIPASFLKATGREGIAAGLFAGWRHQADGSAAPDFPLDQAERASARILLTGDNFGCGSSREHAAWALYDHGFRAVVAPSFADIFRHNAERVGVLPVAVSRDWLLPLAGAVDDDPDLEVEIDLQDLSIRWSAATASFRIEPFARHCLLHGIDAFDHLLSQLRAADRYSQCHPAPVDTLRLAKEHRPS